MSKPTPPAQAETPDIIERLRALEAKATKGRWYLLETPWLAHGLETMILAGSPDPHVGRAVCDFQCQEQEQGDGPESNGWNDADFIVALRNALPELVAHCSRLKAERDAAEAAALERAAKCCEKRAADRWEELGYTEPDTNASYYVGASKEWNTAQDEEDENCAAAIRALIAPPSKT